MGGEAVSVLLKGDATLLSLIAASPGLRPLFSDVIEVKTQECNDGWSPPPPGPLAPSAQTAFTCAAAGR
jgi:hypothetical protein